MKMCDGSMGSVPAPCVRHVGLQQVNRALQREAELVMDHLDSKPKSRWWLEGGCSDVLALSLPVSDRSTDCRCVFLQ